MLRISERPIDLARSALKELAGRARNLLSCGVAVSYPSKRLIPLNPASQRNQLLRNVRLKNYATALAFVLLLAHFALAQDSQFLFDANGNLALQMAETSGQPQILRQPQNQVVAPGEAASFSVVVADSRGLTPQWLFNGTNINGAMSDTLLLTNVNALEEGQYSVVLSNSSGSVTSAPALLMLDSDGDGLPDSWELAYFGNLNQTATGDFDGDGISNLNEFLDGTNPTNSASVLLRLTLFTDGGQVTVNPNRDFMWTGPSGGDWNTNSNWNFNITPGTNDLAYITNAAATVTINSAAECGSLIFGDSANAPTLTGNGTLTLRGASVWTAGTMGGTGRTVVEAAGSLLINNSGNCFLSGRTLENGGTIVWTGAGIIGFISAVITNRPGALFDVQNASTFFYSGGNVSRFDNAGTFRKSVGAGTSTFANNVNFNNYSAVEIQSGTLLFGGGLVNIGTVALSPGTTNRISGAGSANGSFTNPATSLVEWPGNTYTLNSGAQLNGSGLYRVTGSGVLVCNTDASVENLNLDDLLDGSGRVTINHTMNWTGGSMFGSGRTIIAPTATLNIANASAVTLSSRTLENGGTVFWTGGGGISLASTVITNRTGALFSAQNSATISFQGGAICRFDNAGTFRKSVGAGTCTFANNVNFNNYSAIELQTGTLLFGGSLLNNGTVTLSDGTTNRISGGGSANGSFTNPATSLVEWPGSTYTLNSGAQLNGSGLYRVTGSGGVTCNADVSVDNLNVEYLFDGSGRVTINNTMNWTASSMSGSGRTIIAPGATLNIANPSVVDLSSRTLENGGTVFWTGAGGISLTATVITNRAGALFHCQNAASITYRGGNVSRFDNAGTFRKSSAGTSMIGFNVGFNNYNAVDIRSGIVVVDGNYTSSAGAVLNCSLGGAAVGTGYAQLKSGGTIGLNGALNVYFTNGFYPTTNTTFTVVSAGTRSGTFGSFSYPSNIVIMQLSNSATSVVLRVNDLTTNGPPQITSDFPTNQVFYAGRVITLSPTVAGVKPFTYQWKKNGTDLSDDGRIAGATRCSSPTLRDLRGASRMRSWCRRYRSSMRLALAGVCKAQHRR